MKTLESIASEALLLPADQRLSLAHQMLISLDGLDPDIERAWEEEFQRRIQEYDDGKVSGIPGPEVFRAAKEMLRK